MPFYNVAAEPDTTGLSDADSFAYNDASSSDVEEVTAKQMLTYMWGGSGAVAAGSALTVTAALHAGKVIKLDTAAGSTCTLPAATGTGNTYRFVVSVLATSNSHIVKVANSSDIIQGTLMGVSDDPATVKGWIAGAADDTITLNRGTTGSVTRGELIQIMDIATNLFLVQGWIAQTGTEATPFSSTV